MTSKMIRTVFAFALAASMLAAFSSSGHAALSSAERPAAAPATEQVTVAAAPAEATNAVTAPAPTATAPVAELPRKTIAPKVKPQRFAASPRKGYPCH